MEGEVPRTCSLAQKSRCSELHDIAKMKEEALSPVNRYAGQRHRNRRMTDDRGTHLFEIFGTYANGTPHADAQSAPAFLVL